MRVEGSSSAREDSNHERISSATRFAPVLNSHDRCDCRSDRVARQSHFSHGLEPGCDGCRATLKATSDGLGVKGKAHACSSRVWNGQKIIDCIELRGPPQLYGRLR